MINKLKQLLIPLYEDLVKVNINNTSPYVDIDLTINAKILSLNNNDSKLTTNLLNQIEDSANKYITSKIYSYLNKTYPCFFT